MRVIVVGAGFGGVAAAIELRRNGFTDVTILDAAQRSGGTWFYNTYPGAACDVPSHFYSYSFAQRDSWSKLCSPQHEILDYLRGVIAEHGLEESIVTGAKVTECRWHDDRREWTVLTEDGETRTTDAVVLATGQLNQPARPNIPGVDDFTGKSFHSARWDHDYDLRGKRVAVIGSGASAVQFVPEVAAQAAKLTVFQRTGNWFLPRKNKPRSVFSQRLRRRFPFLGKAERSVMFHYTELITTMIRHPNTVGRLGALWSTLFMRLQVRDRELRRKIWPDYTFGCKRVLFSSAFLPALQRSNVALVDEAITEMTPQGPRSADGRVHEVDCVIYGTGFRTTDFMFPMRVVGEKGKDLTEEWADGAHAYLGMTVPGFPSLFILYGPNTNTSGGSIIFYLETQARYVRLALQAIRSEGARAIDVLPEVESRADTALQERFAGTAWTRCDSWYRNDSGRIVTNWPDHMRDYRAATHRIDHADYRFLR